jgi:hypothetical protein
LFVHLELAALGESADGALLGRAIWRGLRVESAGSALLGSYLRRCGLDPLRKARAVSLVQPIEGRPGSDRVMVLWGLLGARRLVACLGDAVRADGGSAAVLLAGGEPAASLDRAASDLHLDVLALDGETLLAASGQSYRAAVRSLAGVQGKADSQATPLVSGPLYSRAVAAAPRGAALIALWPRFPRALPHLFMPREVSRSVQDGFMLVSLTPEGLALSVQLRVTGLGRAARWAKRLPDRTRRVLSFAPASERPFLTRARPTSIGDVLRLELPVTRAELPAFGRAAERWLPW